MVEIQRPPGVNVGINNPGTIVYVSGNESTDGSIRYEIVDFNGALVAEVQLRTAGLWAPTSLKTGPNSVIVGTILSVSAAGTNLITVGTDGSSNFHVRSRVDDGVTTKLSNIVHADAFFPRVVFFSDEDGEFTGTSITAQNLANPTHIITNRFYFKIGATAATEPVRIQSWDGIGDGGTLVFDQTYPASEFPVNTEVNLTLEGFLEFVAGADTFTRISSDAAFSLKTNLAKTQWWLAADVSRIDNDDLLQTHEWITGNTFTLGELSVQNRLVYECNVTGIQTGVFNDNLDKWDQLISIQGFDRILNSVDGNSIADNAGDLLVGSA